MQTIIEYYKTTENLILYTAYILGAIILATILFFIIDKILLKKNKNAKKTDADKEDTSKDSIENENQSTLDNDNLDTETEEKAEDTENDKPLEPSSKDQTLEIARFIIKKFQEQYYATLYYNGEILYSTDYYTSLSGVKSMIDSFVKSISQNNFALTIDENKNYAYKLYFSQTKEPFVSKAFLTLKECKAQIELLKAVSKNYIVEVN